MGADITQSARRLRDAAEANPLKLPVRRRVDEQHHVTTEDGLSVWFTIEESPHSRIHDAVFERSDRPPTDEEIHPWLAELMPDRDPMESPAPPGSLTRRFEAFEKDPAEEAPIV